jgi:hypothetical protein
MHCFTGGSKNPKEIEEAKVNSQINALIKIEEKKPDSILRHQKLLLLVLICYF